MTTKKRSRQIQRLKRRRRGSPSYSAISATIITTICMAGSATTIHASDSSPLAMPANPAVAPTPFADFLTLPPTEPPTFTPTLNPTMSPSKETMEPTTFPTVSPTPRPSEFAPTEPMPIFETESPTNASNKTLSPSEATPAPTEAPSILPSLIPSMFPSLTPTDFPSLSPSIQASLGPSVMPSLMPTLTQSNSPSSMFSLSPSTPLPSTLPSSAPSNAPSVKRSTIPTSEPSVSPTLTPSLHPSMAPTVIPSLLPTTSPSDSSVPTLYPTSEPSDFPSSYPSSEPSLPLQGNLIEVVMVVDDAQIFIGRSIITWETVTGDHIRESIVANNLDPPMFDLRARTNVLQMFNPTQPPATRTRRRLQQRPLRLVFDADVEYRSLATYNVSLLVGGAFDTSAERSSYLQKLQQSGDRAFASINDLRVSINGVTQESGERLDPGETSGSSGLFIIIGAVAGGLAFAIFGGICYIRHRQKTRKFMQKPPQTPATVGTGPERINTDIVVDNQDDISTLGDPSILGGMMQMGAVEKDEATNVTGIVSGDYDYAKQFGSASGAAAQSIAGSSKLLGSFGGSDRDVSTHGDLSSYIPRADNSLFSDDASFEDQFKNDEERFEIIAPAGKLGMVIDTPTGGVPIVHAIKEASPLAATVIVGDRLMSVDDEDTTGMTAMQVSKLISAKADLQNRKLVFARTRNRANSADIRGSVPLR